MRRRETATFTGCSPTRLKFLERRRAIRQSRLDDKWEREHTYICRVMVNGRRGLQECGYWQRFLREAEGYRVECRKCKMVSVCHEKANLKWEWLPKAQYDEIYLPPEVTIKVEDVYRELHLEKRVKDKSGIVETVPEIKILVSHAPWCGSPDVSIAGLTAKIGGPGRVRWRDAKGVIRHNCVSSEAGRRHAAISNKVQGHTGAGPDGR